MKYRAVKKYLKKRLAKLKCNATDNAPCKTACCIDCRDICGNVCKEAYSYMVNDTTDCPVLWARENIKMIERIQRQKRRRP